MKTRLPQVIVSGRLELMERIRGGNEAGSQIRSVITSCRASVQIRSDRMVHAERQYNNNNLSIAITLGSGKHYRYNTTDTT
jgi:hypothetical protein